MADFVYSALQMSLTCFSGSNERSGNYFGWLLTAEWPLLLDPTGL